MQGSPQLRARHGDRVADEILHDHEAIVRRAIAAHGGDEAAEIVAARRPGLPVAGGTSSIGAWNMLLGFVEALALAGRPDEVAAPRPLLDGALALDDWISFDGRLVSTRAAVAAAAARDWEAAERHFATAIATAEALGNRIEQVDLAFWRARMLLDRDDPGDRAAAATLAAEVVARYRELGLRRHAEEAAALHARATDS